MAGYKWLDCVARTIYPLAVCSMAGYQLSMGTGNWQAPLPPPARPLVRRVGRPPACPPARPLHFAATRREFAASDGR